MKTPSHCILNLAILGTVVPNGNIAITLGAILPDLPIFIFYIVAKFLYKLPESQIWTKTYHETFWQDLVAFFHSFPLALLGLGTCLWGEWQAGAIAFASILLHSLVDFPVHHDDAHRHFFPFSNYRFFSPISYWDPKHHGRVVALVELLLVLAVTPLVWGLLQSEVAKVLLIIIAIVYLISYIQTTKVMLRKQ